MGRQWRRVVDNDPGHGRWGYNLRMPRRIDTIVGSAAELATARYLISDELRDYGVPPSDLHAILLAVHEAAKNALHFSEGPVQVSVREEGHQIDVSVADPGKGFDPNAVSCATRPDSEAPCGRGLALMKALMDEVMVQILPTGCLVRMAKRIGPAT